MNVVDWKRRNFRYRLTSRLRYPWPFYKRAGGISAVVIRANGDRDDLGRVSDTYLKRKGWSVRAR